MFLDFEYSAGTIGCCLFCQAPIGGKNRECIVHGFDVICFDCARKITEIVLARDAGNDGEIYVCGKCGAEFDNKGAFLAHHREHRRREVKGE